MPDFEAMSREDQIMATMLTLDSMAGRSRGFTESDRQAMAEGLDAIRTAMAQPFGTERQDADPRPGGVSTAEYEHAKMRVVLAAMRLWLSGRLISMEVDADE